MARKLLFLVVLAGTLPTSVIWRDSAQAVETASGSVGWTHFRGGEACGVFRGGEDIPPVLAPDKQLVWKVGLLGRGPSSPIVVNGQVVVTAATGYRQDELHILSFAAESGRKNWHVRIFATGSTVCNPFGGVAASTPASDGRFIVALFSSNDLVCLDCQGRPRWMRPLGWERPLLRNDVGMASSPLIVGDVVVVQAESLLDAVIFGIDLKNGRTLWQKDRTKEAMWSSPVPLRLHSNQEGTTDARGVLPPVGVLVQSREDFEVLDPRTGTTIASYGHWCDTISSAAVWGRLVVLPAAGIHALEWASQPPTLRLLWISDRLNCGNTSPVVWNNRVYLVKSPNILVCADAVDGRILRQIRMRGSYWASPVIVGRHLYAVNYEGTVFVFRLDEDGLPERVGEWDLESGVLASPAVDGTGLYFRTHRWLYKFAFTPP
ncbi:PQQ-binding-like beta-propeller repeat protein [Thermogutta sp.]|uniref:outer membrane protein assembly factor BamB family protein n=1 Tax=Thermogutta sp. TaxID=1962930 RepID=UPI003C7AE662